MTRSEALGSTLALIAVLFSFLAVRMIYPSWVFLGAIGGVLAAALYPLLWIFMRKHEDERIQQIQNLSMRNGFAFLFFAVPLATLTLILQSVASEAVTVFFSLWWLALIIMAISKSYYYYRK